MREASVGFQCPECVALGQRTQRQARTAFGGSRAGRAGYVTISLIALNVIVLLVGAAMSGAGSLFGGIFSGASELHYYGSVVGPDIWVVGNNTYIQAIAGAAHYTGVDNGAVYRLLTSMFIHYGPLHLLMNMWALWVLGRVLEEQLGPWRFAMLYLLSGLGGSVAAALTQPDNLTAGASGAVFGLFAALFITLKRLGRDTSSVVPVIVINLVLTFAVPGISIAGHIGGLLVGTIVGAGLAYAPRDRRTAVQVTVFIGTALVLAMLTAMRVLLN
ncbi:rhomboid family intramembrane serine protease [Virgisporangium aliadipatigenens]|uniref:Rhomboid family intramembrane serine protease n=2 Tax=Virgisporangium aliadipatigenens TaxID=741659 RepID=A0A8J3YVX2_9ACTN|nr:rhomboid family intramembrane serine protease [Virgisporangium aliadipatigenens]